MNKNKKTLLLISLAFFLLLNLSFASGDGNIDTGGGNMGDGTGNYIWHNGDDGVRVTIIKDGIPVKTMDFSNKSQKDVDTYFGKVNKLSYKNGQSMVPIKGNYERYQFSEDMPKIITSSGTTNLNAIKQFFCNEGSAKEIANLANIDYEHLINDDFKLLIEPIAYFTYCKSKYAMTATEAALYNKLANNDLRKKMGSLTSKNLPLSMFLEISDLGISKHTGSTTTHQDDDVIIDRLGCGIVSFIEGSVPDPVGSELTYPKDIVVYTSFTVKSSEECNPNDPAYVTIKCNGYSVTRVVYMPAGEEQLIWLRWPTPSYICNIDCKVDICGNASASIEGERHFVRDVTIGEYPEKRPLDTHMKDPNTGKAIRKPSSFKNHDITEAVNIIEGARDASKNNWSVWHPTWHPNIVYYPLPNGTYQPVDEGWYIFEKSHFYAELSSNVTLKAHERCETASIDKKEMKSGYGTDIDVYSVVDSNSNEITTAQTAFAFFPEFNYANYWRILDKSYPNGYTARFFYKKNQYSLFGSRTHFTPIWFPDGKYWVAVRASDAWTPAGELSLSSAGAMNIKGNLQEDYRPSHR